MYILDWIDDIWLIKFMCRKSQLITFEKIEKKYIIRKSNAMSFKNKLSLIVKNYKYISLDELEKIICEIFETLKIPFDIRKLNFQNINIYYLKDVKMFFATQKDKDDWIKMQIRKKHDVY